MSATEGRARLALAQQFSGLGLMVAFAIVSARWLGPSGKGELAIVTTAGVVTGSVIALGIPQALTAWVARDMMSARRAVIVGCVWASLIAAAVAGTTVVIGVENLALRLLWLSAGVTVAEQIMTGVSTGAGDLVPPLVSRWLGGGSQVLLMAGALVLGLAPDVEAASVWYYVVALVGVVVAAGALLRRSGSVGMPGAGALTRNWRLR